MLSECFFQVQSSQIILHYLVPSLAWSSPSCGTVNHQTSTFANPVLCFHSFYVAKPPESHLPHDHRNVLYSQPISHFFRGSLLRQTDATHPSSHLHFCPLESAGVFYLNQPCFIKDSTPDTSLIDIAFHFM